MKQIDQVERECPNIHVRLVEFVLCSIAMQTREAAQSLLVWDKGHKQEILDIVAAADELHEGHT